MDEMLAQPPLLDRFIWYYIIVSVIQSLMRRLPTAPGS